jgi:hypothetical protein
VTWQTERFPVDVVYSRQHAGLGMYSGTATSTNESDTAPWSLTLRLGGLTVHELTGLPSRRRAEFLLYAWVDQCLAPDVALVAEVQA